MDRRNDHWALAGLMIGQYGQDAMTTASRLAAEAEDAEVSAIWHSVVGALRFREQRLCPAAGPQ